MNKQGPILIIDDDKDDRETLSKVFTNLGHKNQLEFFSDGQQALKFLLNNEEIPFLILSDIGMPKLDGLELREIIQNDEALRMKCIPYVFFTTAVTKQAVWDAYMLSVQGFFIKPNSFEELEKIIEKIVDYWLDCKSPGDYI